MKKILLLLLMATPAGFLFAQSVGIGTTTPNASAKMEIKSTNSGLLIPSMTTSQRITIVNPAEGLLVYDITNARLYQYRSGAWQFYLNDEYWTQSPTHKWVFNVNDSIGIGTAAPSERLHVAGNIKATNLLATLEVQINNSAAILQTLNGSTKKTFIQLSGENLRMGTNSGNTTGNVYFSMNGTDRIRVDEDGKLRIGTVGVSNPTPELDVYGGLNFTGGITKTATSGNASLVPVCYGTVAANGTVSGGTGNFTSTRLAAGHYRINCTGITSNSVVVASAIGDANGIPSYLFCSIVSFTNYFEIKCFETQYTGGLLDSPVQFIAYK